MKCAAAWLVVIATLFAAPAGRANPNPGGDTSDERTTAADRLFEEGRKLAKSDHPEDACKRFEQSFALKPTFGTAVNLGDCARHDGHPGRAWRLYHDAIAAAERDGAASLARFARDRAASVSADLW